MLFLHHCTNNSAYQLHDFFCCIVLFVFDWSCSSDQCGARATSHLGDERVLYRHTRILQKPSHLADTELKWPWLKKKIAQQWTDRIASHSDSCASNWCSKSCSLQEPEVSWVLVISSREVQHENRLLECSHSGLIQLPKSSEQKDSGSSQTINIIGGTGAKDGSRADVHNSGTWSAHRSKALLGFNVTTKRWVLGMDACLLGLFLRCCRQFVAW